MDKALLVGIRAYQRCPLLGCLNDVCDVKDFLINDCGFNEKNIKKLVDADATRDGIIGDLKWLLDGLQGGDRILFHFSGHGAQYPGIGETFVDEVILPFDYDKGGADNTIHDKQFHEMFRAIPEGVTFFWVSDSCHSGSLDGMPGKHKNKIHRTMPMTRDVEILVAKARENGTLSAGLAGGANALNLVLLSACRPDQYADDALFENDRPNGVLTYFLLRVLRSPGALEKTFEELYAELGNYLPAGDLIQEPQLAGSDKVKKMSLGK